jgi:hypothetical protein
VVTEAGQIIDDRPHTSIRGDPQDTAAFQLPTLSDKEGTVRKAASTPRPVAAPGRDHRGLPIGLHSQQPRGGPGFAIRITRFDNVRNAVVVDDHARRKRETRSECLYPVPARQRNIRRPHAACRGDLSLTTTLRRPHPVTPGRAREQREEGDDGEPTSTLVMHRVPSRPHEHG